MTGGARYIKASVENVTRGNWLKTFFLPILPLVGHLPCIERRASSSLPFALRSASASLLALASGRTCRGAAQRSPSHTLFPNSRSEEDKMAAQEKEVSAKEAETTAMTETTVAQIDAGEVPEITSGPLATTEEAPEVSPPSAKPSPRATAIPSEEPKQTKSQSGATQV
ncbi:hypothetical protein MRX96_040334 [Rhipicephalus microplus]